MTASDRQTVRTDFLAGSRATMLRCRVSGRRGIGLSATDVDRRRLIGSTIVRDSARCVLAGGEVPGITRRLGGRRYHVDVDALGDLTAAVVVS